MARAAGDAVELSGVITIGAEEGLRWIQFARHELLLFAAFWFIVGAIDELAVDFTWLWLRLLGQAKAVRLPGRCEGLPLKGRAAVLVPAWQESQVIGLMIRHTLSAWPQWQLSLYVGCYRNDAATLAAAVSASGGDPRLRIVIHDAHGPTTKADCLNRLYAALRDDETRSGVPFSTVVLQDAEDMVHPAGLAVIDRALGDADFVQLPVRPEIQPGAPWISGHYADEFTESHAKALIVRDSLGAALPAAGVGCGFSRSRLFTMERAGVGPFSSECLTEDYELGMLIGHNGGKSRFLRLRDSEGRLVATRSFFPCQMDEAVRQKSRWIQGIALQGWDRLGWKGRLVDHWMALRDRRGPLTALVLFVAYMLVVIEGLLGLGRLAGVTLPLPLSPELRAMLLFSTAAFGWRLAFRFAFTAHEYGWREGLRSVVRMPIANVIAILAGRRAMFAYLRSLRGESVSWDKTAHHAFPTGSPHPVSVTA